MGIRADRKIMRRAMKSGEKKSSLIKASYFGVEYFVDPPTESSLTKAFNDIADHNAWGSAESLSGVGSSLNMTARVRDCLGQWIDRYKIKTFMDIPCGDGNWQGHIPGLENIRYYGYDIADKPIEHARTKNARKPWMSFDHLDLTENLPPGKPDIIMVRDVIQHLPLAKGQRMLLNAKNSGASYLAVTSFTDGKNIEIPAGSFFLNNVHNAPFNLPEKIEACQNNADPKWYPDDFLELIDLSAWNP